MDKVRWNSDYSFTACCVAHDDRNPSMSVSERDGRILVYCHSGCPQEAVLDALGIGKRDREWTPPPHPAPKVPVKENTYYRDIWDAAYDQLLPFSKPYDGDPTHLVSEHPYAKLKKVKHAAGARRGFASGRLIGKHTDCIIVPSYDFDLKLVGVECIGTPDANGKTPKQSFGKKSVLILGNDRDPEIPILMLEGWASAVAWVFAMNNGNACGAVFFGKSSGKRMQAELQAHYPKHVVLLGIEQDD